MKSIQTLSVSSGKGGVGKTTLVTNLAHCLTQQGGRVLILDGDLGMANVDIMFGHRAQLSIADLISGRTDLHNIILEVSPGISLIPGGSGVYGLHNLDQTAKAALMEQVSGLDNQFDFMLIDTAPGISDNVLYLNAAAQETLVVVTPDPASLTDAYALIKVLHKRHFENRFSVVCNLVRDEIEALSIFRRLSDVAAQFLCVGLDYKGHIPMDPNLRRATKLQQLICRDQTGSPSSEAISELARKLSDFKGIPEIKGGIQFFWRQMAGVA